ncbi:MAG TPA: hypothetical protein DGG95_15155, partial [Cytophagales bacterium]|nr:hypothetical protein [Cytophagales bacterium]
MAEQSLETQPESAHVVKNQSLEFWDPDERYKKPAVLTAENVHTIPDLVDLLRENKNVEVEAR